MLSSANLDFTGMLIDLAFMLSEKDQNVRLLSADVFDFGDYRSCIGRFIRYDVGTIIIVRTQLDSGAFVVG